jgi:hypothetical protein
MKTIKEFLFGRRREAVEPFYPGITTLDIQNRPSFQEWCNEFRVSMLFDRRTIQL